MEEKMINKWKKERSTYMIVRAKALLPMTTFSCLSLPLTDQP
jgi:hypothetical protein